MKNFFGGMVFTSLLVGGIWIYGKCKYKSGQRDTLEVPEKLEYLKEHFKDIFFNEEKES